MEMTKADSVKDELMMTNPEFRELVREHGRYEQRLSELSALTYPSDEEQLEEICTTYAKFRAGSTYRDATAVERFNGVPPYRETQNYVARILSIVGPQ